jgi:hypothetical protein
MMNIPLFCASLATGIQVKIGDEVRELDRETLKKMPYFNAHLDPVVYMLTIPPYVKYRNIAAENLPEPSQPITLPLNTTWDDFMLLYNELERTSQESKTEDIKRDILDADLEPERILALLNLGQKLLTVEAALPVLDNLWLSMLKKQLYSESGIVAKAFFAPQENLLAIILALIRAEQKSIRIACYRMSHPEIMCELARAKKRGISVSVIVDRNDADPNEIENIHNAGINLYLWEKSEDITKPKMHHKFFLFAQNINDQPFLVTGSANCTWLAQEINEENIVVINDPTLIEAFDKEWSWRLKPVSEYMHSFGGTKEQYIENCVKVNQGKSKIFTPQAQALFAALVRIYAEYILVGSEPFGIEAIETKNAIEKDLEFLGKLNQGPQ